MRVLSLVEAKTKLSRLVSEVVATDEEVTITKNGRAEVVMMSYDEFESWKETVSIASDPELMAEIRKGITQLKKKRSKLFRKQQDIEQLFTNKR